MKIKNEAELLNKFCDKTHIKEILTEPFFNTNYNEVWSSDGVVLIRINPKVLTNEYPKKKLGFPKLEFPCEKTITIEALNKAFNSCPMVDEEVVVEDAVECEECDGSGTVYWEYTDNHENTHERLMDCPICNGEGEIEPCKTKKTGKKIIVEDTVIEVRNAHIFANRLLLLKTAMKYINVDTVKMTHNAPYGASEFIINKDIRIIIMPMSFDYNCECSAKLELID
jgi:hypothetical protein